MPRAKPTKKRKFYGNKYTRPLKETAKPCASEEKLQYTKKRSVVTELNGYRLIASTCVLYYVEQNEGQDS